jgi:hypothetical protein
LEAVTGRVPPASSTERFAIDKYQSAVESVAVKIRDMHNDDGVLTGFAVNNLFLRRRGVGRIIRSLTDARIIREQPPYRVGGRDDFLEFVLDGITFLVIEPFGDNSEYWIVSEPTTGDSEQLRKAREAFRRHRSLFGLLRS